MRISDWSSDVCSSDLAGQLAQPVVGVAFHVHHMAMLFDQRDRRLEARALQAALVKVFRRGVGTGDQHHALGEHPLEQAPEQHCVADVADEELVEHQHPRSEEHTSELQSLMRISYAVFCLKQNKRK